MRFYGSSYKDALDLPLRTFWLMSNNITRLSAEEDLRSLSLSGAATSEKGFKQASEALQVEMGSVFIKPQNVEAKEGIKALKELASKQLAKK